ncbi:electron transport complex subunit RsxG [Teredinibacter turnerae]|uniref:electron transport complex subunit RsxG n=1 Tax=Teredinibacter turnerae TaxID=2426 RepID=UPI00036B6FA9|nr:electron transport complex subunit RsxG [Teredinibacter turnerae]
MIGQSISKNSLVLALFALATAGVLATTYTATEARIAEAEKRAAESALLEIVPRERHDNDMLADSLPLPANLALALGVPPGTLANVAYQKGVPIAVILPSIAPDGYSGTIKLIVGINADGSIAGVRALSHKETPGLGDKVDLRKSDWVLEFNGKSLGNPSVDDWAVKKDGGEFDQFTGATITPRAVVKQVKQTLQLFQEHKDELLPTTPPSAEDK